MSHEFATEIDDLCARLQALKTKHNVVCALPTVDEDCPEDLGLLNDLVMDVAKAIDPFFASAALSAGLPEKSVTEYSTAASNAPDVCDLHWEIEQRVNKINAERDEGKAPEYREHMLGARQLGVGAYR